MGGLCLTEHHRVVDIQLQRKMFDKGNGSFRSKPCSGCDDKYVFSDVAKATKTKNSSVTAILCLIGLPRDLTASILAHEATHAWLKLHPHYDSSNPLPAQVEEGVCQLVAHLLLTDGLKPASTKVNGKNGVSDEKLRQYFKFAIEADQNEVYGEGFRKAAEIYATVGIYGLLSYIVHHRAFPDLDVCQV